MVVQVICGNVRQRHPVCLDRKLLRSLPVVSGFAIRKERHVQDSRM